MAARYTRTGTGHWDRDGTLGPRRDIGTETGHWDRNRDIGTGTGTLGPGQDIGSKKIPKRPPEAPRPPSDLNFHRFGHHCLKDLGQALHDFFSSKTFLKQRFQNKDRNGGGCARVTHWIIRRLRVAGQQACVNLVSNCSNLQFYTLLKLKVPRFAAREKSHRQVPCVLP